MKFDDFDAKMRVYEQSLDQVITPGTYMIARLDGHGFTRFTKEICKFEAPFDERFRNMMVNTTIALMNCGFRVIYGFTESDEISLLFHPDENTFGRKVRKYNSILAGVASAKFTLETYMAGFPETPVFDCRMIPLPSVELVQDYFIWRQEDAHRNSLNSHCYWMLRKEGKSVEDATEELKGKSVSYKNDLLFSRGINYNELPSWQKRGIGIWKEEYEKTGFNPITEQNETTTRKRSKVEYELPTRNAYSHMIRDLLRQ